MGEGKRKWGWGDAPSSLEKAGRSEGEGTPGNRWLVHKDPNVEDKRLFHVGPVGFTWRGLFWGTVVGAGMTVLNTELWRGSVNPDHVELYGRAKAEAMARGPELPPASTLRQYLAHVAKRQMVGTRVPLAFLGLGIFACNAHYTATDFLAEYKQATRQKRMYLKMKDRGIPEEYAYDAAFRGRY